MDKFEALASFVHVVEQGGISRAAEHQQLAKSAISRRLTELEQHLGVQLFHRTTRQMQLTDTGQGLYERAVRLLADLEDTELTISAQHGALSGRVRVAAPLTFGLTHLAPAINEFLVQHPQVTFDIDFNDRQVDILQERIDVAIRIARLEDSSLMARHLTPIRTQVVASPAYLDRYGIPITPTELAQHRCLLYSNNADGDVWRYHEADGHPGKARLSVVLRANNGEFLRDAAIAGHGITYLPTFICAQAIASGTLVPILTAYRWQTVGAYAVYSATRQLSQRVRYFIDFLVERFAATPSWDRGLPSVK